MVDIASDIIAGIALLVSLGTFGYNVWQARKRQRGETFRKARIAFALGKKLMDQWQSIILVGKGEPEEIEHFREQVLITVSSSEALADQLGIDFDLRSLLKADQGMLPGGSSPFSELGEIIQQSIPGEEVYYGYELGVWVTFVNWAIRVGTLKGDATGEFQHYKDLVGDINTWINKLGLNERFNPNLQEADAVAEEANRVSETIRYKLLVRLP
jgi:hypothetical protein